MLQRLVAALFLILLVACGMVPPPAPPPTPEWTPSPSGTPHPSRTPSNTPSPSPTATSTPTATPSPTATDTPTPTPAIDPAKLGTVERNVVYCIPDDLPQTMDVYYPSSGGPWPVLVYIHGGAWISGDKAEGAGWRGMTEQGYLVVSINYRLSENTIKFPSNIEDVKCAIRHMRANASIYNLNPNRIGAIGASAGGHLAALAGVADKTAGWEIGEYPEESSRLQAVLTIAGVFNLASDQLTSLASAIFFGFDDLPASVSAILTTASPLTYVSADDPPFLLMHGSRDGLVPPDQSREFYLRLLQAGVPAELIIVEGGDHGLQGAGGESVSPSKEDRATAIKKFFATWLKP